MRPKLSMSTPFSECFSLIGTMHCALTNSAGVPCGLFHQPAPLLIEPWNLRTKQCWGTIITLFLELPKLVLLLLQNWMSVCLIWKLDRHTWRIELDKVERPHLFNFFLLSGEHLVVEREKVHVTLIIAFNNIQLRRGYICNVLASKLFKVEALLILHNLFEILFNHLDVCDRWSWKYKTY